MHINRFCRGKRESHNCVVHMICRKLSHFNLLLRNHWANCNQTLVELSLDVPLPKMFLVIPTSNQDGRQAKNSCFSISQNELKF
jgi:hypothetical protein